MALGFIKIPELGITCGTERCNKVATHICWTPGIVAVFKGGRNVYSPILLCDFHVMSYESITLMKGGDEDE